MILDLIAHASDYHAIGPRFAPGLHWLATFSNDHSDGRYDIDGDRVYALVQSYTTLSASDKSYESHRLYADIQFLAAGVEIIHYASAETLDVLSDYDPRNDFTLHRDPPTMASSLVLSPGAFAIFLPRDAHKPGCFAGRPSFVRKVVVKVRL